MARNLAVQELIDLMRVEREAIRSADFSGLAGLSDRKEIVMARLEAPSESELTTLRRLAAENQRLFDAALKGVQAAQARLRVIVGAARGFDAYDASGRKRPIRRDGGAFERRA